MTEHVMSSENFSRGGFPLPSPRFMIQSILLPWWSCFCFTGMVAAPHA